MPKHKVEIVETLGKVVEVEAKDHDTALEKARERYENEEIVLDADSFQDVSFNKI